MSYQAKVALAVVCVVALGVAMMPQSALAQIPMACTVTPEPQQMALTRPIELGTSGGNIKSIIKTKHTRGCFSGTLGSMVEDADENEYILSNNHVLADTNKAKPGQLILQPGLIDVACLRAKSNAVATFSSSVKIRFGGAQQPGRHGARSGSTWTGEPLHHVCRRDRGHGGRRSSSRDAGAENGSHELPHDGDSCSTRRERYGKLLRCCQTSEIG